MKALWRVHHPKWWLPLFFLLFMSIWLYDALIYLSLEIWVKVLPSGAKLLLTKKLHSFNKKAHTPNSQKKRADERSFRKNYLGNSIATNFCRVFTRLPGIARSLEIFHPKRVWRLRRIPCRWGRQRRPPVPNAMPAGSAWKVQAWMQQISVVTVSMASQLFFCFEAESQVFEDFCKSSQNKQYWLGNQVLMMIYRL